MGDRASVGYLRSEDNSFVFFYGHWIGESIIDTVALALEVKPEKHQTRIIGELAVKMFDATDGAVDISGYTFGNNYPTLIVREYHGQPEVTVVPADVDELLFDATQQMWVSADKFIDYAEMTSPLKGYDRFLALEALMIRGI